MAGSSCSTRQACASPHSPGAPSDAAAIRWRTSARGRRCARARHASAVCSAPRSGAGWEGCRGTSSQPMASSSAARVRGGG
eukprot:scaffold35430_cov33-Phaeocystis_antarctica.AAC.1